MSREFSDVQAGFNKGRGTRYKIANIHWIIEKVREFQKNIYFYFIDYAKAFVWITTYCGKFLKRWEYQTTWPASWEICIEFKKQKELKPSMKQQIILTLGKEYVKAVYCNPVYLTYMLNISWKFWTEWSSVCESYSVMSDTLLYSPWNSLGQNTGVDSLSLLQGIFPT